MLTEGFLDRYEQEIMSIQSISGIPKFQIEIILDGEKTTFRNIDFARTIRQNLTLPPSTSNLVNIANEQSRSAILPSTLEKPTRLSSPKVSLVLRTE